MLRRHQSHITRFSIHRNYGFGMMIETEIFEAATLDGLTISINDTTGEDRYGRRQRQKSGDETRYW